jgi:hypothetical protein
MTRFVDAEDDKDEKLEHPSFGMVSLHAIQGSRALFGVDYPTGHSLTLEIAECEMHRDPHHTRYYERSPIIKIELSEVQWARLVASMNSTGVPCTIRRRQSGDYVGIEDPPQHMTDAIKMKDDVEGKARRIAGNMEHLQKLADELASPGGKVTKEKLKELAMWAQQTKQALDRDMPYLTQCMTEQVDDMVQSARAEIDAHVQFSLNELGKVALSKEIRRGNVAISVGGHTALLTEGEEGDGQG